MSHFGVSAIPDEISDLLLAALNGDGTSAALAALARKLDVDAVLAFVMDDDCQALVPAPGFPRTLPTGRGWVDYIRRAQVHEFGAPLRGDVPWPGPTDSISAVAAGTVDGVLVLLRPPDDLQLSDLAAVAPLFLRAAQRTQRAQAARMASELASDLATEAENMRAALDRTRRELRTAVIDLRHGTLQLEQAVKIREDFLSVAAHELKNPIQVISGFAAYLHRRLAGSGDAGAEEALSSIAEYTGRMVALVDLLLDVSKLDRSAIELELEWFSLTAMVTAICREVDGAHASAERRAPRVEFSEGSPVMVFGDPTRLRQVVTNLVLNGLKYSDSSLYVRVSVTIEDGKVQIVVKDGGIGIAPEELPTVFQPFMRGEQAKRMAGGTGLGLYVCKSIVEQHGGTIDVTSTLGEGTTFKVRLPLHE